MGHVCNEDAALAMADVITDETKHIYLAHLSLDNNMKELARMSVSQVLEEKGFGVEKPLKFTIQIQNAYKNSIRIILHLVKQ